MFSSLCYFISFFSTYTFIHNVVNNIGFPMHSEMPAVWFLVVGGFVWLVRFVFFFFYLLLFIRENTATLVQLKAYVTTKELKMSRGP